MIKFKLYFILLIASISLFSCSKDSSVAPPRDRTQQYSSDIDSIEKYLHNHYIKHVVVNGEPDIELDSITDSSTQVSIWDNTEYPLKYKIVKNDVRKTNKVDGKSDDTVEYKLYYLMVNEGGGQKPTSIDSTFTSYKGWTLYDKVFDARDTPVWSTYPANPAIGEIAFISGYRQFIPELKSATGSSVGDDGSVSYTNPGMGVVFIPSGLGYYNKVQANIGEYSPLVFKIRLHSLRYRDHDRDGILSKDEDTDTYPDTSPNVYHEPDFFNDDTDGDNIPNFLDVDDDGDVFSTRFEIKKADGTLYSFGEIPDCSGNTTDPNRIKKHLDKNCH